jgi:hypothetical protein
VSTRALVLGGASPGVERKAERVEAHSVVFAEGEEPFDLLVAVPPHRSPTVLAESGLLAAHDWIGTAAVRRGRLPAARGCVLRSAARPRLR